MEKLTKNKEESWRTSYHRIRVFQQGEIIGSAVINLTFRKKLVANCFVQIYDRGKFPWFRKKHLQEQYLVNIPLPMMAHIIATAEKKGFRIRRNKEARWHVRTYRKKKQELKI